MAKIMITDEAVYRAKRGAMQTREELIANLQIMQRHVLPSFSEWDDDHIKRFLEVQSEISDVIQRVCERLDAVCVFCDKQTEWMQRYLDR